MIRGQPSKAVGVTSSGAFIFGPNQNERPNQSLLGHSIELAGAGTEALLSFFSLVHVETNITGVQVQRNVEATAPSRGVMVNKTLNVNQKKGDESNSGNRSSQPPVPPADRGAPRFEFRSVPAVALEMLINTFGKSVPASDSMSFTLNATQAEVEKRLNYDKNNPKHKLFSRLISQLLLMGGSSTSSVSTIRDQQVAIATMLANSYDRFKSQKKIRRLLADSDDRNEPELELFLASCRHFREQSLLLLAHTALGQERIDVHTRKKARHHVVDFKALRADLDDFVSSGKSTALANKTRFLLSVLDWHEKACRATGFGNAESFKDDLAKYTNPEVAQMLLEEFPVLEDVRDPKEILIDWIKNSAEDRRQKRKEASNDRDKNKATVMFNRMAKGVRSLVRPKSEAETTLRATGDQTTSLTNVLDSPNTSIDYNNGTAIATDLPERPIRRSFSAATFGPICDEDEKAVIVEKMDEIIEFIRDYCKVHGEGVTRELPNRITRLAEWGDCWLNSHVLLGKRIFLAYVKALYIKGSIQGVFRE